MKKTQLDRVVIVDANILINFINVNRLDLLYSLPNFEIVISEHVLNEIKIDKQVSLLNQVIKHNYLKVVSIETTEELEKYVLYKEFMGKGEASCLAIAETHGWLVASDERGRFLSCAVEKLGKGRIINTAGILLQAIKSGILSVEEADKIKNALEGFKFRMKFSSFGELL